MDNPVNQHYEYIVGIDFGTYATSWSFARLKDDRDIQTIEYWPSTDPSTYGGRVASSLLYKNEDEAPLWGGDANRKFFNKNEDLFHVPHIKLYLTDSYNQPPLPGDTFTPVKLVSDYLKQLHAFCISEMKTYFEEKNTENQINELSISENDDYPEEDSKIKFYFTEDNIRYVFSYPDNQGEEYQAIIKEAFINAGIISDDDPKHRLQFYTESGATAYFCSTLSQIKPSQRPYLVCDIGGTVFGVSVIEAKELIETGTISTRIDNTGSGCGNLELDNNIRRYLSSKVTTTSTSEDDIDLLEVFQLRLFKFYLEEIKNSFDESSGDFIFNLSTEFPEVLTRPIESECIDDDDFVLSYEDLKREVFDPVTDNILRYIQRARDEFENGISGIFLSGTIGSNQYLRSLVDAQFGTAEVRVTSVYNNASAISEGLVHAVIRQSNMMIPYFVKREVKQKYKVMEPGNENPVFDKKTFEGVKKISHKDIDYIIGLDFGTTYSGFAFAPVPQQGEGTENHSLIIKDIKSWPRQTNGNYPKAPSMLYYDENMVYQNKFGYEAQKESQKKNARGILLRHFKLLLSREFDSDVDDRALKNLNDDTTVSAISNYFKDFVSEGVARMKRIATDVDPKRLGYVVTVPTLWSDEAKNTLKVAIQNAGLVDTRSGVNLDERVVFITEAEAAVLYCQKYYNDKFYIDKGSRFMICDAGAGMVDVVTFEIDADDESHKLQLNELTSSDGDNCGSAYLDENFKNFVVNKLNNINALISERGIDSILDQFIRDIKPNFEPAVDPDLEDEIKLNIPTELGLPADFSDPTGFIVDDGIIITYSEMEREVFQPVVNKVLALIDKQLKKLPEGERTLDAILIVGGFGQSLYLHKKVADRFESRSIGARFVGKPPDGDLAICRGAVSFGLEPRMVSDGITRFTYGLQVKDVFRKGQDEPQLKTVGYDGKEYCQNVFSEIVARETKISKGTLYSIKTFVTYPNNPIFAIYSFEDKNNSRDARSIITNELKPILTLTANIQKIPEVRGTKPGEKIEFEVLFEITGTDIQVHILHEGRLITEGITKANTIVKTKYVLGGSHEKKKSRWKVPIFSFNS